MFFRAGDSFGAGVEFKSREWIAENVDFTRYVNAREGKWAEGFAVGKYTDDTEMTLGLVRMHDSGFLSNVLVSVHMYFVHYRWIHDLCACEEELTTFAYQMKALMETGDLRSVDDDVLLAYWHNEYARGVERNGFGRQGHGSILYHISIVGLHQTDFIPLLHATQEILRGSTVYRRDPSLAE